MLERGGDIIGHGLGSRVAWQRPTRGHCGPVTRRTPMTSIPFLNLSRALGDFWSFNVSTQRWEPCACSCLLVVSLRGGVSAGVRGQRLTRDTPRVHQLCRLSAAGCS